MYHNYSSLQVELIILFGSFSVNFASDHKSFLFSHILVKMWTRSNGFHISVILCITLFLDLSNHRYEQNNSSVLAKSSKKKVGTPSKSVTYPVPYPLVLKPPKKKRPKKRMKRTYQMPSVIVAESEPECGCQQQQQCCCPNNSALSSMQLMMMMMTTAAPTTAATTTAAAAAGFRRRRFGRGRFRDYVGKSQ